MNFLDDKMPLKAFYAPKMMVCFIFWGAFAHGLHLVVATDANAIL